MWIWIEVKVISIAETTLMAILWLQVPILSIVLQVLQAREKRRTRVNTCETCQPLFPVTQLQPRVVDWPGEVKVVDETSHKTPTKITVLTVLKVLINRKLFLLAILTVWPPVFLPRLPHCQPPDANLLLIEVLWCLNLDQESIPWLLGIFEFSRQSEECFQVRNNPEIWTFAP